MAAKRSRGSKQVRPCECCGKTMVVRSADVKRGWGRFCSKSCKAKMQPSNEPKLTPEQLHEADMDGAFASHGQDEGW